MYWRGALLIIFILFSGCNNKSQNLQIAYEEIKVDNQKELSVLKSLFAIQDGDFNEALDGFVTLFEQTKDTLYLKEAIKIAYMSKNEKLNELFELANKYIPNDNDILRFRAINYLSNAEPDKSKDLIKQILKTEKTNHVNHSILAAIYVMKNQNDLAFSELKKAYELENNEINLIKFAEFAYLNPNTKKQAIFHLEKWIKVHGCTRDVCLLMANIYAKERQLNPTINTYLKLYDLTHEEVFLQYAISLYISSNNLHELTKLLEKYDYNKDLLLEVYVKLKQYQKAILLSQDLYLATNNIEYKAKMAVFKYEQKLNNIKKTELEEIVKLFEESVHELNSALYYNYYGYLLIDHELDVKKGLNLAIKAHELESDSLYIIDSVAWGYYKLRDCENAKLWIDKVKDDANFMSTKEAKEHKKSIYSCKAKK